MRAEGDHLQSALATAPAATGQRVLWALQHYRGGSGALNVPVLVRIREPIDRDRLQAAIDALVARHEALRTTFRRERGRLTLVLHPPRPLPVRVVDLSAAADPDGESARVISEETRTAIDPAQWPIRASALKLAHADHVICLNIHHLVTDDSSSAIIVRDFAAIYNSHPRDASLPAVGWQYSQFAKWQARESAGDARERHLRYWMAHLAGASSPALPPAPVAGVARPSLTKTARADLDPDVIRALQDLARRERSTFFTVLLSAFFAALADITGQMDLAVSSLFSERSRPELLNTVGYFVSPLVLRVRIDDGATFSHLVRSARATVLGAIEHQSLPYHLLPPHVVRSGSLRPDDLVLQVLSDPAVRGSFEVLHRPETDGTGRTFEMEIVVRPWNRAWTATAFYASGRFRDSWVKDLLASFVRAAVTMARNPQLPVISVRRR